MLMCVVVVGLLGLLEVVKVVAELHLFEPLLDLILLPPVVVHPPPPQDDTGPGVSLVRACCACGEGGGSTEPTARAFSHVAYTALASKCNNNKDVAY